MKQPSAAKAMLLSLCMLCGCTGDEPADRAQAQSSLITKGLVSMQKQPTDSPLAFRLSFGLDQLAISKVVSSKKICEGAAGSAIPPLAASECTKHIFMAPITAIGDVLDAIAPGTGNSGLPVEQASLRGIEKYWVHQSQPNNCWAASLQTARDYLHLHHMPQKSFPELVEDECPALQTQRAGADAYQIAFVIAKLANKYDGSRVSPHFCTSVDDIVTAIRHQRPVIMLKSGHAVLLVGVKYIFYPARGSVKAFYSSNGFTILDPEGSGEPEERSSMSICTADAFIAL